MSEQTSLYTYKYQTIAKMTAVILSQKNIGYQNDYQARDMIQRGIKLAEDIYETILLKEIASIEMENKKTREEVNEIDVMMPDIKPKKSLWNKLFKRGSLE